MDNRKINLNSSLDEEENTSQKRARPFTGSQMQFNADDIRTISKESIPNVDNQSDISLQEGTSDQLQNETESNGTATEPEPPSMLNVVDTYLQDEEKKLDDLDIVPMLTLKRKESQKDPEGEDEERGMPSLEQPKWCGISIPQNLYILIVYILSPLNWIIGDVSDIVSDIMVAASHYNDENFLYFGLTLAFVLAPSLALYLVALNTLAQDRLASFLQKCCKLLLYSVAIWTLSIWPLGSYILMIYYGLKALFNKDMRTKHIQTWKKLQDESLPVYNIIKAFLESAPQMALQLYIILANPMETQSKLTILLQIISITLSLISMSEKAIRFRKYIQEAKMTSYSDDSTSNCLLSLWNLFLLCGDYLWWTSSIAARMIAIVIFASVFHRWIFIVCAFHALVMLIWIVYNQPNKTMEKFIVSVFVAIMYIFCFVEYNVDFGRLSIFTKYAFYYLFMICQNTVLVLGSYFMNETEFLEPVQFVLVVVHFSATLVDILFMVGYLIHSKRFFLLSVCSSVSIVELVILSSSHFH